MLTFSLIVSMKLKRAISGLLVRGLSSRECKSNCQTCTAGYLSITRFLLFFFSSLLKLDDELQLQIAYFKRLVSKKRCKKNPQRTTASTHFLSLGPHVLFPIKSGTFRSPRMWLSNPVQSDLALGVNPAVKTTNHSPGGKCADEDGSSSINVALLVWPNYSFQTQLMM